MFLQTFTRRRIATCLLASYCIAPAMSLAQVVLNAGTPNDGRRAYVDQTQNGLPKINIATPNGAGVSRNTYQDFNVGKQGLILNNGANNSNTSLAGWVEGNPNLTPGNEARLILNEVVGGRPSQLLGFLEVAGKKADVIVTNENGVTCNGCGFINTSRITLGTGAPIWSNAGQLDGFKVRQGTVLVGSEGLSAPDARIDLLSQVINIQGSMHAAQINAIAGGNDVRYDDLSRTRYADIQGTLDIAALGGMYANQIQLVATGTGVGMRVDGTLVSAGNVAITSDGLLVNAGSINAQGRLTMQTDRLENAGTLNGQTLDITVDKVLNLGTGTVASSGEAAIHATTFQNLGRLHTEGQATLDTRRVNNAGIVEALGGLTLDQAWTVQNTGSLSGSDVTIRTQAFDNSGRVQADRLTLSAYQDASIPVTDRLGQTAVVNSGVVAADRIAITGYGRVVNSNQISTDIARSSAAADSGKITLQAGTFDNTGGSTLAKGRLTIDAGDVYNNRATLGSKGDLAILASGNIDNGAGLILHQGTGSAQVQAGLALNNAKGQIEGQGQSLDVVAGDIDNTQGQIIQTTPASAGTQLAALTVTAQAGGNGNTSATPQGQLVNIQGKISSTGNGTVSANSIVTDASSAQLGSGSSLSFLDKSKAGSGAATSTGGYDWNKDIAAANAVTQAQAAADAANTDASAKAAALKTAQDNLAKLKADNTSTQTAIDKATSDVSTAQTASDNAAAAAQTAAQALAAAKAAVPAIDAGTAGTNPTQPTGKPDDMSAPAAPTIVLNTPTSQIQAGQDLTLNIGAGLLDNRQGSLAAGHDLNVNAEGDVLAGQMAAGNALNVSARQLEVAQQIRGKTASVTADTLIVTGRVQGDDSLLVKADAITNSGTLTGKVTQLQGRSSAGALVLGNSGMVQGNDSLAIQAKQVLNQATLASGGDLTTQTQYLENQALVYSGGHQYHYGVELVNNAGRFYALGDITMQGNAAGDNAQSILNYIGRIEAQGNINLKANNITNRAVVPTVNVRGVVEKTITPTLITTSAKDTFNADGKSAEILAGKNLNINADTLSNEYGILSARLNANIATRLLSNRAYGAIQTQNYVVKAACFNCHQTVSYSETWGGVISAGGTATVTAVTLDNKTIDTRDGFAGLSTDPRVVIVDERSGTASPLTQAFKDRFGIVNGPASSSAGTTPNINLGSARSLSDGIVLQADGTFDFSHYSVPNAKTGLFEEAPANSPYLIRGRSDLYTPATNGQYTQYDKFAGSDYLLTRLGLIPSGVKLLGDAWYETQLVQEQMYALKGRTNLVAGTDNDYDLMRGLMDAGLLAQAKFGLGVGDSLSAAQQAALTQDMVWPEWQVVDGQRVLVPKLYVAHQETENDNNKGARIVGNDVAITTRELKNSGTLAANNSLVINASGNVSGGGSYSGGKTVAIVASNVDLKSASIQSGGWLNIETANDLNLTATQVKAAGDASLTAGGALNLKAQEFDTKVVRGDGTSRTETKFETSNVDAGGTLTLKAKKDLTLEGSAVNAGNNLLVQSQEGNVKLVALKETSDYNYKGEGGLAQVNAQANPQANANAAPSAEILGNTQVHEERVQNVRLNAKGNVSVVANQGDVKATALDVNAGQDITLQAGGKVQLEGLATTNTTTQQKSVLLGMASDPDTQGETAMYSAMQTRTQSSAQANGGTLKAGNDVVINGGQVNLSHTQAEAGRDVNVQATDGGAALTAVNMQAGRDIALSSAGNVAILSEATITPSGTTQASSSFKAANQVNVTALGDLDMRGGDVQAKDVNLMALGDVRLAGVQAQTIAGGGNDTTTVTTTQTLKLKGENVNIQGVGQSSNVSLQGVEVDASNKAKVAGTGNVVIASGEDRTTHEWRTHDEDCNWYGKCTVTETHGLEDRTTQVGSVVKGGQAVEVTAGKDLTTLASRLESGGDLTVNVGGKANYLAALNVERNEVQSNSSSSWGIGALSVSLDPLGALLGSKSDSADSSIQTRVATTSLQSEADVLSNSGGDTRLQGTQVKAQNFTVNTGVGPNADPNAKIVIEGVKETLQTSHTEKTTTAGVWQSASGSGKTEESLVMTNIQAKTKFNAPGGIDVQLPAGDPLKEQVKTLSQQPGMEWLKDLSQRKDVNWQQIKLAKDQWDYSQEGLTGAGAVIVVLIVTYLTAGTGTAAVGTTSAAAGGGTATTLGETTLATTTAEGVTTYTASGAAINAAVTAATSQAAVMLANNKGDIGKTLQDMGNSDNVKSLITSAVTAGALETVNPGWAKQLSATGDITQKAVINLTNAVVSATVKTAVQGGSYEDNLTKSLKTAGVDTVAGWAASNIGDGYKNGEGALSELQGQYIAHKVAHALLGCASAGAKDQSCAAGAIGGAVGEAFAEFYSGAKDGSTLTAAQQQEVLNTSKLVVAAVAGLTGKDAQAAVDAAQNAVINNFLFAKSKIELNKVSKTCQQTGDASSCARESTLRARDAQLDILREQYSSGKSVSEMKSMISKVDDLYRVDFDKYGIDQSYLFTMANIESSFRPSVVNPSGYAGLYQFGSGTASDYKISNNDLRLDPVWSAAAAAQYAIDNAQQLAKNGVDVTPVSLYMAHQQGAGGVIALQKNPTMNAVDALMTIDYYKNKGIEVATKAIFDNMGSINLTADDFIKIWTDKYNKQFIKP